MKNYAFKLSKVDRETIDFAFYVNMHVFNQAAKPIKNKVKNSDYFNASMIKQVDSKVKDEDNHYSLAELCQMIEALASTAPFFISFKSMNHKDVNYFHQSGSMRKEMTNDYPKLAKRTWSFINEIISNNSRSNKSRNLHKTEAKIESETKRRSAFIGESFEKFMIEETNKKSHNNKNTSR